MTTGNNYKGFLLNLFFVCVLYSSKAQTDTIQQKPDQKYVPETYCMNLQDGVTVLMADGQQVTSDVTLKNGMRITAAGKVIRADGTEVILKDKDCVNANGEIISVNSRPFSGKKSRKK